MGLTTKFENGTLSYDYVTASDASGSTTDSSVPLPFKLRLGDGVLANQANTPYRDSRTLSGASYTYTLSTLPNGATLARERLLAVWVDPASTGTLDIVPGDTNPWGVLTARDLGPGSFVVVAWPHLVGAPVASGSADKLKFTATGSVTYVAFFIGANA